MEQLFKERKNKLDIFKGLRNPLKKKPSNADVPDGLYSLCKGCGTSVSTKELIANQYVCPKCSYNFRLSAIQRLEQIVDSSSFVPFNERLVSRNPLNFDGYEEKIAIAKETTGLNEAIVCGTARILGTKVAIGAMDTNFMMASMGEVVGEKITRLVEMATKKKLPVVIFCCSGGARMQEGILSLMQMAKTSAALAKHSEANLLYISVLTDPTTGGVSASFAMLGDIIIAEPNALIGFAGPRVIQQTMNTTLPEGFQRAEFLVEKGFVDMVVERSSMKDTLGILLKLHERK
ncbi:MAG: acetyl-CoA carboxylase, carboxyltransferase subunit beta [Erysipelotrichaceae bacterium]